jgi:hypothetical protein
VKTWTLHLLRFLRKIDVHIHATAQLSLAALGREIRPADSADTFAGRDVHHVKRELHAS